jgi:thiamine biosynthesis protein ThiS
LPLVQVIVNGTPTDVNPGASLVDLLNILGLGEKWVIAERNGVAVARGAMATTVLAEDDRIELVRAVAGG